MKTRTIVAAALGVTLTAVLSGCGGKFTEPFKDAPRSKNINSAPADTVTMPDGFSNVATKCEGPNRVYVVYHGDKPYGSIAVVANDPRCGQ
ncbi:hypothetical protein [Micromonospora arborensis]|uniref:hypothetical protein n=1 Tax=Micromonospora arborensis TaxID=2116518 RepID=UPI0037144567